ncbi:MAG TPA: PA2169 family four-helix-bundle protein [Opitutus sp.]|nr:PA2169 family four-helix-bundle protein [Opitutus sp.]
MNLSNKKTNEVLNDLIKTCRDGQEGYATAAKDVKDGELVRVFTHYSTQRAGYATELEQRRHELGGEEGGDGGSMSGALRRGWVNLKSALTTNAAHAVLAECERGEDAAVQNYRDALHAAELDMATRSIVQRQAAGVQEAHARIKELRDSVAYAHR